MHSMEPECAVAAYREGDVIHLYSGSQNVYDDRHGSYLVCLAFS